MSATPEQRLLPGDLYAIVADARSHLTRGTQHPYCESCVDGISRLAAEIEQLTIERDDYRRMWIEQTDRTAEAAVLHAFDSVATSLAMMGNPRDALERREVVRWLRRPSLRGAMTLGEYFDRFDGRSSS